MDQLGVGTCGIWTRAQALEVLTPGAVRAQLRDSWQIVLPGVYADGGVTLDATQRAWAAVLASGGAGQTAAKWRAVAAGRTAARHWRMPLIDDDDPATGATEHLHDTVAVRHHRPPRTQPQPDSSRVLTRQQLALAADDVIETPTGLLVSSRPRTLLDCARVLTHEALVCAVDAVLHAGQETEASLAAYALLHHGEPGAPALHAALAVADRRAESPHETLTRLLLLPVLPGLVPQVELFDKAMRLVARFDLGDETARFAVESDGTAGHAGAAMVAKDRKRDRRASRFGWWTERVTWWEVRRQAAQTRARVLAEYRKHLGRSPDR